MPEEATQVPSRERSSINTGSLSSSTNTFASNMSQGNSIGNDGKFRTATRTPLLDPIYLSTLTSNFGPYRKLILTSISDPWFKTLVGAYDDTMIIAASAICDERLNRLEALTAARHSTLLTGELAAPFLPPSSYMSTDEANAEFVAIVKSIMRSPSLGEMFEGLNVNSYAEARGTNAVLLPQTYPFTVEDCNGLTLDMAIRVMKVLSRIPSREIATNIGVLVITNLIVSICKQGTVSGQFIDKIKSAIQKDIGRSVPVKANYISSIWGAYGQYINETNIGPLMDHFLRNIMGESIRLRVTVDQAKYQALTMYQTIGRTIILNPNLSWQIVEILLQVSSNVILRLLLQSTKTAITGTVSL